MLQKGLKMNTVIIIGTSLKLPHVMYLHPCPSLNASRYMALAGKNLEPALRYIKNKSRLQSPAQAALGWTQVKLANKQKIKPPDKRKAPV